MIRWNQLDLAIVLLSLAGIVLEEMDTGFIPINPTIIRVMRVLRIARGSRSEVLSLCRVFVCVDNTQQVQVYFRMGFESFQTVPPNIVPTNLGPHILRSNFSGSEHFPASPSIAAVRSVAMYKQQTVTEKEVRASPPPSKFISNRAPYL